MRRNLLSVSLLIRMGCSFFMDCNGIKISRNSIQIGSGVMWNDYLKLNCSVHRQEILLVEDNNTLSTNTIIAVKRTMLNEKSANLWHRRLGHISKERLQLLMKNKILNELYFSDLDTCVECFKGKMTNSSKKNAIRS